MHMDEALKYLEDALKKASASNADYIEVDAKELANIVKHLKQYRWRTDKPFERGNYLVKCQIGKLVETEVLYYTGVYWNLEGYEKVLAWKEIESFNGV